MTMTRSNRIWFTSQIRNLTVLFGLCMALYYSYAIGGILGLASFRDGLRSLHNFYGLDFFALVFFVPVVYAAYTMGVATAVQVAMASALVVVPEKSLNQAYPYSLFRPAAYGIILSAVGAAIALLQKSDAQRQTMIRQLEASAQQRQQLEASLKRYSESLEEMVKTRTEALEQAQAQLIRSERLAAVGELASSVAHELRNPLNVIKNCTYLLNMQLKEKAGEDVKATLKLLDRQIDISSKIIADLLDFTRIRHPNLSPVDLNGLLNECLASVAVPENVRVIRNLDGQAPRAHIDPEQIGRAFVNIVTNAIQSITPPGTITITTGIDSDCAWATFEDTGCGIPQQHIATIFEPLFTTKPKGSGLGLAITRKLVEQNRGAMEVSSELSRGTTFTVKLPIYKNGQEKNETNKHIAG